MEISCQLALKDAVVEGYSFYVLHLLPLVVAVFVVSSSNPRSWKRFEVPHAAYYKVPFAKLIVLYKSSGRSSFP